MLAALLLAPSAWGADGDSLAGASVAKNMDGGALWSAAYVLCDAKVAADSACAEFDLDSKSGMPSHFVVSIDSANNCTAGYKAVINGTTLTGGALAHTWGTIDAAISSLQVTGPVHRFLSVVVTTVGCDLVSGDGLTVNIVLYYDRN